MYSPTIHAMFGSLCLGIFPECVLFAFLCGYTHPRTHTFFPSLSYSLCVCVRYYIYTTTRRNRRIFCWFGRVCCARFVVRTRSTPHNSAYIAAILRLVYMALVVAITISFVLYLHRTHSDDERATPPHP